MWRKRQGVLVHSCSVRAVVTSFPTTRNLHHVNNLFSQVELTYFPPCSRHISILTLAKWFFVLQLILLSTVRIKHGRQCYHLRATSEEPSNRHRKPRAFLSNRGSRRILTYSDTISRAGKLRPHDRPVHPQPGQYWGGPRPTNLRPLLPVNATASTILIYNINLAE